LLIGGRIYPALKGWAIFEMAGLPLHSVRSPVQASPLPWLVKNSQSADSLGFCRIRSGKTPKVNYFRQEFSIIVRTSLFSPRIPNYCQEFSIFVRNS
jgi:hypothetical protein